MRFCMVSTFYPPYHFGGDAIYVQRLSHALADRGHTVDVIHDRDAYHLARREPSVMAVAAHPNVHVLGLHSPFGLLSPLATHQTGRPWLKPDVRRRLTSGEYDVIHFHNPSLIGSASFAYGDAVKLYTLHEHWLVCPMHVLWKFDREACDRPECVKCCLLGGRPPQLWRYTGRLSADLPHIDRFLSPSRFTRDRHEQAGLRLPITVLPHFAPSTATSVAASSETARSTTSARRPYFLFVGRLVKPKGVDSLVRAFRQFRDADLLIAGEGEEGAALRVAAADLPHVQFLGAIAPDNLASLYRDATALVMPSVGYEVFGMVLLEALSVSTPVIARDLGALPEVVEESGGGITFRTDDELVAALRALHASPDLRRTLGDAGHHAYLTRWTETIHLDTYLHIVQDELARKAEARGRASRS